MCKNILRKLEMFYSVLSIVLQYWSGCGENIFCNKKRMKINLSAWNPILSHLCQPHINHTYARVFVKNLKKVKIFFFPRKNCLETNFTSGHEIEKENKTKAWDKNRHVLSFIFGSMVFPLSLSLFKKVLYKQNQSVEYFKSTQDDGKVTTVLNSKNHKTS